MENVTLISRWYSGMTVPEYFHMSTKDGDIRIFFTQKCWNVLREVQLEGPFSSMRPLLKEKWGIASVLPPTCSTSEGITLTIPVELQLKEENQRPICQSLAFLMYILERIVQEKIQEERPPQTGEQLQLFSMELYCSDKPEYHACPMGVSVSPEATHFLSTHEEEVIPGVHEAMKAHHAALYPKDKKIRPLEFLGGLRGIIREHGTLGFVTMGNCACLGSVPEQTRKDQGHYIDSHNLDTPWQQLSMIVGVAATWQWVRKSLGYK